jgi:pantoate--beta-alanine ligase
MLTVLDSIPSWRTLRAELAGQTLGFVPTLGGLHAGHAALVERSVAENDRTLVSVFLNPTQFDEPGDLDAYPADAEADRSLVESLGADYLLRPSREDVYPDGYRYRVVEDDMSRTLCGAHRPGHFDGVLTVVLKLFQIVSPDRAYFGEKDHQQLGLVRGMVRAFFLPVEIVACATVREEDGLAASSRNRKLDPEQRRLAPAFPALLRGAPRPEDARRLLEEAGFGVDYVEEAGGRRYGAVRIGRVRLIDNVPLSEVELRATGGDA